MTDPEHVHWSVYMIRVASGNLYTGISIDPVRRFQEHTDEGPRCARYLRGKGPLDLVLVNAVGDKSAALRVEYRIKRLSKADKERLIRSHHCNDSSHWQRLLAASGCVGAP